MYILFLATPFPLLARILNAMHSRQFQEDMICRWSTPQNVIVECTISIVQTALNELTRRKLLLASLEFISPIRGLYHRRNSSSQWSNMTVYISQDGSHETHHSHPVSESFKFDTTLWTARSDIGSINVS